MDPRHETKEQVFINEIIGLINRYGLLELDATDDLLKIMHTLAEMVYHYSDTHVDVDALLAKKNRLSIDVILLPQIDELSLGNGKQAEFPHLLKKIADVIEKNPLDDLYSVGFMTEMQRILSHTQ